jgi:MtN3 and saliva related transmembrane protein
MPFVEILGYVAGAVTTFTFLPQVIKTAKDKAVKDISLLMFVIAAANEIMWVLYGVLLNNNWVIILTNSILLVMSSIMIYFKLTYK